LPPLELPLSAEMIPQFLFVSEFLYTFADALGLKRRLTARELSKLMAGGRGLGDLYLSLLQVREYEYVMWVLFFASVRVIERGKEEDWGMGGEM
jgi:hypothetical protein